MKYIPSMTEVNSSCIQPAHQLKQYIRQCRLEDYVRASVVAAVAGYAAVIGSVAWATAAFLLFSLINGPTRRFLIYNSLAFLLTLFGSLSDKLFGLPRPHKSNPEHSQTSKQDRRIDQRRNDTHSSPSSSSPIYDDFIIPIVIFVLLSVAVSQIVLGRILFGIPHEEIISGNVTPKDSVNAMCESLTKANFQIKEVKPGVYITSPLPFENPAAVVETNTTRNPAAVADSSTEGVVIDGKEPTFTRTVTN